MNLRKFINDIKPNVMEGGKFHAFRSLFEGFESFLFVSNETSRNGSNIHDSFDSKRLMIMVVVALCFPTLFGMYNIGYQNAAAAGMLETTGFWAMFFYGLLVWLPKIIVSYVTGLAIEFTVAQWKGEENRRFFKIIDVVDAACVATVR